MWIWKRKIHILWKHWWISRWLFQPGKKDGGEEPPCSRPSYHLATQILHQLKRQKIPIGRSLWRALLARCDWGWHRMLSFTSPSSVCSLFTFPISLWTFSQLFLGGPSHDMWLDTSALAHRLWPIGCSCGRSSLQAGSAPTDIQVRAQAHGSITFKH